MKQKISEFDPRATLLEYLSTRSDALVIRLATAGQGDLKESLTSQSQRLL